MLRAIVRLFSWSRAKPFKADRLPEVASMVAALKSNRIDDLTTMLSKLPEDLRYATISRAIDALNVMEAGSDWMKPLEFWAEQRESCESACALGEANIDTAWNFRGSACASDVDDNAWPLFYQHLKKAEQMLDRAILLNGKCPAPFGLLLICYRGLSAPRGKAERCFEILTRIAPHNYYGASQMMEILKSKWGGSDEEMFAFARQQSSIAPDGEAIHALVVDAHFEMWNWEDEDAGQYFKAPDVHAEIVTAWERSVAAPGYQEDRRSHYLFNLFAAAFHLAGDKPRTREALARMKNVYTDHPWDSLANRVREYVNSGRVVDRVAREAHAG